MKIYLQGPLKLGFAACLINETVKSNNIGHINSTNNVTYNNIKISFTIYNQIISKVV
jgi:hypothetical protein